MLPSGMLTSKKKNTKESEEGFFTWSLKPLSPSLDILF